MNKEYVERGALLGQAIFLYDEDGIECSAVSCANICFTKAADVVEVKHGRWVMKEIMIKSPYAKNAYCSECLEETAFNHNYCPNCGAKMDGE